MAVWDEGRKLKGFSLPQFLISMALVSVIAAVGLKGMKRFQGISVEANQVDQNLSERVKVESLFEQDISHAIYFDGSTTRNTFFEGVRTYGILPYPFQAQNGESDGIQIFRIKASSGMPKLFEVQSIVLNTGPVTSTITLNGNYQTLNGQENLIAMTAGQDVELFKIEGSSSYDSVLDRSVFTVSNLVPNALTTLVGSSTNPKVYCVQRIIYKVEQNTLFRGDAGVQGSFSALVDGVSKMEVSYSITSQPTDANNADCGAKNLSRWFAHNSGPDSCNWNNVASVNVNIAQQNGNSLIFVLNPLFYLRNLRRM